MRIVELPKRDSLINYLPLDSIGAEVGVYKGEWSKKLSTKAKELHLIDFWTASKALHNRQETEQRLRQEIESGKVILHDDHVANVLPSFPDEYFDWIYIDASHWYADVTRDIALALPKIKKGGYLAGHDFCCGMSDWGTSVERAVIETIQDGHLELFALTREAWTDWIGWKL